jgi:hypothetical protein
MHAAAIVAGLAVFGLGYGTRALVERVSAWRYARRRRKIGRLWPSEYEDDPADRWRDQ